MTRALWCRRILALVPVRLLAGYALQRAENGPGVSDIVPPSRETSSAECLLTYRANAAGARVGAELSTG